MALSIRPAVFREYDIRGFVATDLGLEFSEQLGLAYAKLISGGTPAAGRRHLTVSVGFDCRSSSPGYAEALVRGLTSSGIDVIQLGECPTPLTYFSIFSLDLDGGIMITGSHNDSEYNGFKLCAGKETLHGQQIQDLRILMEEPRPPFPANSRIGEVSSYRIIDKYIDYLVSNARTLVKKKIVIDAGNATASLVAPELFIRLGAEVIPLYCDVNGSFPNHHPDPTVAANLRALVETVVNQQADFGIAFDGDSDRIGLVDENGRIMFGDELMVILSRALLAEHPGATIISEVKSSHRLYDDLAARDGKGIMWRTGHSVIKAKMKETGALLAGEMSGHIFFADRYFGYDDAIYAAMRLYEIASSTNGPVSSLLAGLPEILATPEIRVPCEEEKKFRLVEEAKSRLRGRFTINEIDGMRVEFGDSWGLLRASNTQAALVLRFEAPTEVRMIEIRGIIENALRDSARAIGHSPIDLSTHDSEN